MRSIVIAVSNGPILLAEPGGSWGGEGRGGVGRGGVGWGRGKQGELGGIGGTSVLALAIPPCLVPNTS